MRHISTAVFFSAAIVLMIGCGDDTTQARPFRNLVVLSNDGVHNSTSDFCRAVGFAVSAPEETGKAEDLYAQLKKNLEESREQVKTQKIPNRPIANEFRDAELKYLDIYQKQINIEFAECLKILKADGTAAEKKTRIGEIMDKTERETKAGFVFVQEAHDKYVKDFNIKD